MSRTGYAAFCETNCNNASTSHNASRDGDYLLTRMPTFANRNRNTLTNARHTDGSRHRMSLLRTYNNGRLFSWAISLDGRKDAMATDVRKASANPAGF